MSGPLFMSQPETDDEALYWHFAYRMVEGQELPQEYPCYCLEKEHDDLMQFVGTYPKDHRPAPHELSA